jgi:toxin FitB
MPQRLDILLDSNIVIYGLEPAYPVIQAWIATVAPAVSAISKVEVLGFHGLTPDKETLLEQFFKAATVLPVDDVVIERAILLRQIRKLSLGDSIIAATALEYEVPLATRNVSDFKWITGLQLIDPMVSP